MKKTKKLFTRALPAAIAALVLSAGIYQTAKATPDNGLDCVRSNPAISIIPARKTADANALKNISYMVIVKNNDNAACGESVFELSVVAPTGWQALLNQASISIAPQASANLTLTVASFQTVKAGSYPFAVDAVNSFDYSQQTGATASLYVSPTHIFSLSSKIYADKEINISNAGDLRWNGLVIVSADESRAMVRENMGLAVTIDGVDKKTRRYSARPENGIIKVAAAEENDLNVATLSDTAGPELIADGGRSEAYVLTGYRWNTKDPQNKIYLKNDSELAGEGLDIGAVQNAFAAAANTWDDITSQNLFADAGTVTLSSSVATDKRDGNNTMAWKYLSNAPSALAYSRTWYSSTKVDGYYTAVESDNSFNTRYSWSTNGISNYDVQSVALHELGHTIGLGDIYGLDSFINDTRQVMHYYTAPKRVPGNGDRTGVWKLYDSANSSQSDIILPTISLTAPSVNAALSGTATITATASDNVGVSKVEFYIDSVLKGTDSASPYIYSWDTTGTANGSHTIYAKAYDAAGNSATSASISVNVNNVVSDTAAPNVSLTAPSANTSYTAPQTITITATASDNVGVSRVEFYDGATLLGTDTASPYSYSWAITSANNGSHSLTAKAYDAAGNSATSAAVAITINIQASDTTVPSVSITAPVANTTLSGTTNITATANDNVGVSRVEFYIDGTLKTTDSSDPYSYSWDTTGAANGSHSLTAKAYDAAGNSAVSASVSVNVDNVVIASDTSAPSVSITAPPANTTLSGTATITATASDNVGVSKVEFYVDGALKFTDNASPYSYSWNSAGVANGNHTIYAKAYDTSGNSATTATIDVTVSNDSTGQTICWNGSNNYLYKDIAQMRKFCKCAQGSYGYKWGFTSYYRYGITAYKYADAGDNFNWAVNAANANQIIYSMKCADGLYYRTNVTYYYPKSNVAESYDVMDNVAQILQNMQASLAGIMEQMGK